MKITRFADVPKFTHGDYEIDCRIDRIIPQIEEWQNECRLDLDPDFQRHHVWTACQQSRYVEFLLRGGMSNRTLYFNENDDSFVIVDGKQRLESIRRFFANEIVVFGSYLREYEDNFRMCGTTIRVNINRLKTRKEVLQWYVDLNSGGVVHTTEEIDRVKELIKKEG